MAKHGGKPAKEPKTTIGKAWSKLTAAEKGAEFDASHNDPAGYAFTNFSDQNQGKNGRKAKHKK